MENIKNEIRQLVYELHIQGWTFDGIARQVDSKYRGELDRKYTESDARRDFDLHASVQDDIVNLSKEEQKQVMVRRLQEMWNSIWPKANDGNLSAITTGLKIMQRQAELLGLDAPRKTTTYNVDIVAEAKKFAQERNLDEEETRALIREAEDIARQHASNSTAKR